MRHFITLKNTLKFTKNVTWLFMVCLCFTVNAKNIDSLKVIVAKEVKDKRMITYLKNAVKYSHTDFDLAMAYIGVASDNAIRDKKHKDLFEIQRETGLLYEQNNKLNEALSSYKNALKTAEKTGDKILKLTIFIDLAIVNEKLGNYKIAKDYHLDAIELAKSENDLETIENAYDGLGSLYEIVGDYPKAIEYYFQSLKIAEERKSQSGVVITLQNISTVYQHTKDKGKALEAIERAYNIAQKMDNSRLLAGVLYNYGKTLNHYGLLDEALEKQQASLNIYKEIQNKGNMIRGCINIGDIYTKKENYKEAQKYFMDCFEHKTYISNFDNAQLHHKLGILFLKQNDIHKAEEALATSLNLSQQYDFKELSQKNNYSLYNIYLEKGQHREALSRLETYLKINEELLNKQKAKQVTELQFKYDVEKSEREISSLMLQKNKLLLLGSSVLFTCLILFLIYIIRLKGRNNEVLMKKSNEIRLQNLRLEESNEVLKQFAYVAAHDLKEPLRNIGGFISLIQKRFGKDFNDEANEYMTFVIKAVKRMNNLLGDLLEYSKITAQSAETEPIRVEDILEEVSCNLREKIIRTKAIIQYPPPLPSVRMSRIHLIQLFQNLISNALKFVEKEPYIKIDGKIKGDQFILIVTDNGIGINKDYEHKIFNLFHQLNKRKHYEGTGIGLTICKNIVDKYNGKIWFESQRGEGTTFFISFPINMISTANGETHQAPVIEMTKA